MEPIVIHQAGGVRLVLPQQDPLVVVTKAEQTRQLLNADYLTLAVEAAEAVKFTIGDYVEVFGETYTLNQLPAARKTATRQLSYELKFEGPQYDLLRAVFFDLDANGVALSGSFSLTGELEMFAHVLLNNIQRVYPGSWQLGTLADNGAVKTLTFSDTNCLAAMQTLCKEFDTEFDLVPGPVRTLHFRKVGQLLGETFTYGEAKGLYELQRSTIDDANFITRLYASGSSKNLPANYRNYAGKLRFDDAGGYVEKADAKQAFGLIEGVKIWDDIYPHRTGTITSVGAGGLTFTDPSMDFDLSELGTPATNGAKTYRYLQPGVAAKVQVQSGQLAGKGFEISSYSHQTKTFTIKSFTDDAGLTMPGIAPFQLAAGDTYVLVDILMPQTYVAAAEALLKNTATAYLEGNCAPRVQYSLSVDPLYLQGRGVAGATANYFALGDLLRIVDADLAIDKASRVLSFTRSLLNPFAYTLQVSDSYEITLVQRILADQATFKAIVQINDLRDTLRARYGWKASQELLSLTLDPDGYFQADRIRPQSIETGMLSVGAKNQQLVLNLVIEPNYGGQANAVRVGTGSLTHLTLEVLPRTWQITGGTSTINDNNARLIYAKCNRTDNQDAAIIFSSVPIAMEESATHYHFSLGALLSVDTSLNVRYAYLTYGFTTINGRFIRTGVIQSADGQTSFDLDNGIITGRIVLQSNGGGNTSLAQVEAELTFIQNFTLPNLRKSLTGKIVSYFQEVDPNTWSEAERAGHDGDVWYKPSSKKLYVYSKSGNNWTENLDKTAVAAYEKASQAKETADGKINAFSVQPFPPYGKGDLWANGTDLLICVTGKDVSQQFSVLDWAKKVSYDNTQTAIDGGLITSGTVQLAGDNGSILAGITGLGTLLTAVRFWAGATFQDRMKALFRVLANGNVYLRGLLGIEDDNGVVQAGISGGNGPVRFWAGATVDNRGDAPFHADVDGLVTMTKAIIGKLKLVDGGLIATQGASSVQIDVNRADPDLIADLINIRSISKTTDPKTGRNIALYLEAVNAATTQAFGGQNPQAYAVYAPAGKAMLSAALLNGRASQHYYVPSMARTTSININVRDLDFIAILPGGSRVELNLSVEQQPTPVANGKELTLINLNDAYNEVYLAFAIPGEDFTRIAGGEVITIVYCFGYWFMKSRFDNNLNGATLANVPQQNVPSIQ